MTLLNFFSSVFCAGNLDSYLQMMAQADDRLYKGYEPSLKPLFQYNT